MKDSNTVQPVGGAPADRESWAGTGESLDLRLWLRLSTCTTAMENRLRILMRNQFNSTLPRFDLMAQLATSPRGIKMSDLSRRMMVTNGNITGITDQLEKDGLVERVKVATDRRSSLIRLTAKGRQAFRRMSVAYRDWMKEMFEGLTPERQHLLYELLGELKRSGLVEPLPDTPASIRH